MHESFKSNQDRISKIEASLTELQMKVCDAEEVEEIVAKRLEQLDNNQTLTDVKNKTLSLKVRAQPNQYKN